MVFNKYQIPLLLHLQELLYYWMKRLIGLFVLYKFIGESKHYKLIRTATVASFNIILQ